MVYVDETGFDEFLYRPYGRAPIGERVPGKIIGKKFARSNLVAGFCGKNIIAPLQYNASADCVLFEFWFETFLLPEIPPGFVIVMDNASFHRKSILHLLAAAAGCTILFLPPYTDHRLKALTAGEDFSRQMGEGEEAVAGSYADESEPHLAGKGPAGATLLICDQYYSPDLNPIETFWAWLKQRLQSILPIFHSFDLAF